MAPAVALTRLVNLGWTNGDAVLQIAEVERTLAISAAKTAAANATRAASSAAKEARENEQEQKQEARSTSKRKQRVGKRQISPPLRQPKQKPGPTSTLLKYLELVAPGTRLRARGMTLARPLLWRMLSPTTTAGSSSKRPCR